MELSAKSEVAQLAAQSAVEADLIVLSLDGRAELPAKIREWFDKWPQLLAARIAVLVALFDKPKRGCPPAASTLSYLHDVAVKHGVRFYSHDNVGRDLEMTFEGDDLYCRGLC
jgi:hypothetical protein